MSLRDRIETLSRGELVGLVAVIVVVLAGAGLWYARSLPKPVQVSAQGSPLPPAGSGAPVPAQATGTSATGASAGGVPLIVDVTGAVVDPGVYEFPPGSRVIDAIERAGGAARKADLSLLNLASVLTDGQQVLVPKKGAAGAAPPGTVPGPEGTALVNVNTADATTLETLDGIGEVLAADIIAYREENGPFTSIDQLEDVSGIGPATLEELRDQVTV